TASRAGTNLNRTSASAAGAKRETTATRCRLRRLRFPCPLVRVSPSVCVESKCEPLSLIVEELETPEGLFQLGITLAQTIIHVRTVADVLKNLRHSVFKLN